ncbi:hypothetical protein A9Q81_11520 [Gammaproteobacteria bacterium 42_54_T18]|nr:hypothetical protein A9Q81_11520 [Gammaproteobacteria bacterium 42_54_T18]
MDKYDPLQSDSYTEHLVEVNKTKQVIATEDIFNNSGAIIVPKGAPITSAVAQQILRFKLIKPLHDTIEIEDELSGDTLYQYFQQLLESQSSFQKINAAFMIDPIIRAKCHFINTLPLLRQKLTVMSIQNPTLLNQTIATTWLSVLVAHKIGLDEQGIRSTFVAALAHDIGMLHIDPNIISKTTKLSDKEWRQIQAHSVIAFEILKNTPNIPKDVTLAVLEHHEECDGTGYPRGLFSSSLSIAGQIIGLADNVIAIYTKRLEPTKRSLRDLMPILQMCSNSHFYETYEALITVLRKVDLFEEGIISAEEMPIFIEDILHKNKQLNSYVDIYEKLMSSIPANSQDNVCDRAQASYSFISDTIRGSGILNEGYIRWLEQVRSERLEFAYREMEDVFLMMEETEFQLQKLKRLISDYLISESCPTAEKELIETHFITLKSIKGHEKPSSTDYSL